MIRPIQGVERLSALDATFLEIESDATPMHLGAAAVLEPGDLGRPDGGIDADRIRTYVASRLDEAPRYRQRIARVPGFGHPVWVDDPTFDVRFHVRHLRLPAPGTASDLEALVGELFSTRLDRTRPLWELWIVEGLENGRFALVIKAHHCMVDGITGIRLLTTILRAGDGAAQAERVVYAPRRAPSSVDLLRLELRHRAEGMRALPSFARRARTHARGLANVLKVAVTPADSSALNPRRVRPHRRFAMHRMELDDVKAVKRALGGTVNDAVLAIATGALRRYLARRGDAVDAIDRFRAMLPASLVAPSVARPLGNHIALLLCDLPLAEPAPDKRYARIVEATRALKERSGEVAAGAFLEDLSDVTTRSLVAEVFRQATRLRPYNVVITNVPGPPWPLHLLGARVDALHPMVPLFANQAMGIALLSYAGGLYWGLHAGFSEVPDLGCFVDDLAASFDELRRLSSERAAEVSLH